MLRRAYGPAALFMFSSKVLENVLNMIEQMIDLMFASNFQENVLNMK